MLANAAFLVGAALGIAPEIGCYTDALSFDLAHNNFYRAAQNGLDARLAWPASRAGAPEFRSAASVLETLARPARVGLELAGVDPSESEPLIDLVLERARSGQTGAVWQRRMLARAEARHGRPEGLRRMLETYVLRSGDDRPVHTWTLDEA
jgi:hypothetical protein